ncbi:MAG: sigma factor-like helix-turn-helix DNA-binding protein [Nanoarchaeota archaeon]
MNKEMEKRVEKVLKTLSPREEKVLILRWGIGGRDPISYEFISEKFGVGRERIRQIETKGLRKLRHPVRQKILEDLLEP